MLLIFVLFDANYRGTMIFMRRMHHLIPIRLVKWLIHIGNQHIRIFVKYVVVLPQQSVLDANLRGELSLHDSHLFF